MELKDHINGFGKFKLNQEELEELQDLFEVVSMRDSRKPLDEQLYLDYMHKLFPDLPVKKPEDVGYKVYVQENHNYNYISDGIELVIGTELEIIEEKQDFELRIVKPFRAKTQIYLSLVLPLNYKEGPIEDLMTMIRLPKISEQEVFNPDYRIISEIKLKEELAWDVNKRLGIYDISDLSNILSSYERANTIITKAEEEGFDELLPGDLNRLRKDILTKDNNIIIRELSRDRYYSILSHLKDSKRN